MTHKEFKLVVKEQIFEINNTGVLGVVHNVGDIVSLSEVDFMKLKSGQGVYTYTDRGLIRFLKANFEDTVGITTITIGYGEDKLSGFVHETIFPDNLPK